MKQKKVNYDATTREIKIIEEEVEELIEEVIEEVKQTIEERLELLENENEEIKEVNNTQDILIDTTMMATDEVYTMLEPILEMMPMTMSIDGEMKGGSSKMVDMYVAMVQRGLKTIDQVPTRYREEVSRILTELEK